MESSEETSAVEENKTEDVKTAAEQKVEEKIKGVLESAPATEIATTEDATESPKAESGASIRGEVSASTVARMMGLATASEIGVLEGKVDLLSSRVSNVTVKLERILGTLNQLPSSTDIDRIDINIGSLKTLIRDSLDRLASGEPEESSDAGKLKKASIMTNEDEEEAPTDAPEANEKENGEAE